jgi:hypothetical protein
MGSRFGTKFCVNPSFHSARVKKRVGRPPYQTSAGSRNFDRAKWLVTLPSNRRYAILAANGPVAYLVSLSYPSYHVRHSLKYNLTQTRDRLLRALGAGTTLARVSLPSSP